MFTMSLEDQTIALFIFFPVLCTISLGLRLFVRTRLRKGAFGWDDIALVVTWVCVFLLTLEADYGSVLPLLTSAVGCRWA